MDSEALEMACKRNITIPGQACAYKVGEIKIKQLLQNAAEALSMIDTEEMFMLSHI